MSTLSINSLTNYNPYAQSSANQQQSNFQTLSNALQSGNLSAAQSAFSSLEQTFQTQSASQTANPSTSSGSSTSSSSQPNSINSDFQALASALNSNNLSGAQQAFSQLQQAMQATGKGHHHHHGGGEPSAAQTPGTTSSLTTSSADDDSGGSLDTLV